MCVSKIIGASNIYKCNYYYSYTKGKYKKETM